MKVTYYLEVTSSWCFWAEPMWAELKRRYAGRAEFAWKIAQMNASDYPTSREQCDWISQRPAFVIEDAIGDKAVFSGVVKIEPLAATIDAMLADTAAYAAHQAHHGQPPSA